MYSWWFRKQNLKQQRCTYMWGEEVLTTRVALPKCGHLVNKLASQLRYWYSWTFLSLCWYIKLQRRDSWKTLYWYLHLKERLLNHFSVPIHSNRFTGLKQQWLESANRRSSVSLHLPDHFSKICLKSVFYFHFRVKFRVFSKSYFHFLCTRDLGKKNVVSYLDGPKDNGLPGL